MSAHRCQLCGAELEPVQGDAGEARLDQSGQTYLPARRWTCPGPRCVETVAILPVPGARCCATEAAGPEVFA